MFLETLSGKDGFYEDMSMKKYDTSMLLAVTILTLLESTNFLLTYGPPFYAPFPYSMLCYF
jgi:hypothetical protein